MTKKSIFEESQAQTGIEYLLILAGAVIVVVIIGYVLKSIAQASNKSVSDNVSLTS